LLARAQAITSARRKEARERKRLEMFWATRAARRAGDFQLWHELKMRRLHGRGVPKDLSATAKWRAKWRDQGAAGP
jgi:hypothetical protein